MDSLVLIATLVGLVAGVIAIADKSKEFVFRNNKSKKLFESEFNDWIESSQSYLSPHDSFLRLKNYITSNILDEDRESFSIALCTHYGDELLLKLIQRNIKNKKSYCVLMYMLEKKGIRVGWRAEYVLGIMDKELLKKCISSLPAEYILRNSIQRSISRIKNGEVIKYLNDKAKGNDQKLKSYAKEVLSQINH